MGPSLPSIPDLAQLQFLPPGLNQMAGQQIQTAQDSANQGLALGAQDLRAKQLENMFNEQNNSTRILRGKADLEGVNAENIIKNIEAKQRTELAPQELEAKRSKMVKEMNDNQLANALTQAQQWMLSDNPEVAAKGKDLYFRSSGEQSARAKAEDQRKNTELENQGRKDVANIHAGATLGAARISADARQAVANAKGATKDIVSSILTKPIGTQYAAFTALSQRAAEQGDTDNAALYGSLAESLRPQAEAALNARPNPGAVDAGAATGMPTQKPATLPANPNIRNAPTPPAIPAGPKPALPPGVTLVK